MIHPAHTDRANDDREVAITTGAGSTDAPQPRQCTNGAGPDTGSTEAGRGWIGSPEHRKAWDGIVDRIIDKGLGSGRWA